jgi:hypothetical protein
MSFKNMIDIQGSIKNEELLDYVYRHIISKEMLIKEYKSYIMAKEYTTDKIRVKINNKMLPLEISSKCNANDIINFLQAAKAYYDEDKIKYIKLLIPDEVYWIKFCKETFLDYEIYPKNGNYIDSQIDNWEKI